MGSSSRAWTMAASMGVVEALKDQGVCRWNIHALNSFIQHYCSKTIPLALPAAYYSISAMSNNNIKADKLNKSEDSLRTVMYLCCWGPN